MAIFLGIDGGGSKTACGIGDETALLGSGRASGSNLVRTSEAEARTALGAAIRQACDAAGVAVSQIVRTCVGVAGAARPEVSESVRRLVGEFVPGHIEVVGDMVIALEAAFGNAAGVVVVAGTGSIAYGRNPDGQTARAGGWGFAVSDEGSGHWIGRTAIAAALRGLDEGRPSGLLETTMKAWNVMTLEQLILAANASPLPDFAALVPAVLSAAEAGDRTARTVLTQAGAELAALAKIVIRRVFPDIEAVPVVMSGGVFRNCAQVRQVFYNSLRSEYPQVPVNATVSDPVKGALDLARKAHALR